MDPTNVGFLKWKDPYESKEKHLAKTIKKENERFISELDDTKDIIPFMKKHKLYDTENYPDTFLEYPTQSPKVCIKLPSFNNLFKWKWFTSRNWAFTDTIDVSKDGKYIAIVYSANKDYKLSVKTQSHSWTYRHFIGPDVAILGSRVFLLESVSPLHYTHLISVDIETGRDRKLVYEELDNQVEIDIVKCESRALFLKSYLAGYNKLYYIGENSFSQLSPNGVAFFPVGRDGSTPIYFVRIGSFAAPWKLVGCNWKLNSKISADGIEFCSFSAKILITKFYGIRTIWKMGSSDPVPIFSGIFEIAEFMNFIGWLYGDCKRLWCIKPGSNTYTFDTKTHIETRSIHYGLEPESGVATSSDGLPVRWVLLRPSTKPIGLVCCTYGAYGISTSLNTARWRLWIDAGWAISILFVRGGGDGNEVWADIGRLKGKEGALNDVEACIRVLQKTVNVSARSTVLYGRSAGGLIVGNMAARWPLGNLFGIIYTEVPYVDLLKTASNPRLPLTEYEYKEFGNPRAGLVEFEDALKISPIHQLGPRGAPGIKVLCRSGVHDIQVYPYESLKWIEALRGGKNDDRTKILYIDNEGHHSDKIYKEYAIDFIIINKWNK
jgi:hypothetical protein